VIRLGLFLYDHLASNQTLPKCETIHFRGESKWPVDSKFKKGFAYSDAAVDDSRLVVANALAAKQRGADILTRHEVVSAIRSNGSWEVQVIDRKTESYKTFRAKALVNASGPWVDRILHQLQLPARHSVRLVKGSHIVVPKLYEGSYAYLLQNHDRRVIFVIPYQEHFTLIGTTDVDYQGDPNHARISVEEQKYLCEAVNRYFKQTLEPKHIVWSYAGVRPLQHDEHADPSKVTRDYTFEIQDDNNALPVMSVFGGKITTYRRLAEHALEKLAPYFPNMKKAWTANSPLPGGDVKSFSQLVLDLQRDYPWLSAEHLERLAKAYGSKAYQVLADAKSPQDLGIHFGGSLYEREVRYMIEQEWAYTIEDILWRRSKQGLLLTEAQVRQLSEWLHTQNLP
jgi:glycerol-3-phosphate dehydrogenase